MSQSDPVNNPSHYTHGEIECIDAIQAGLGHGGFVSFCRGNAFKYLWRAEHKGTPDQDYAKAKWYIGRILDELEKKEIALEMDQESPKSDSDLQSDNKKYREDNQEIIESINQNSPYSARDNKDLALKKVQKDGRALELVSKRLRDDKDVVLAAVSQDGWALKYASGRLRDDDDIVQEAIQQEPRALHYASRRLQERFKRQSQGDNNG